MHPHLTVTGAPGARLSGPGRIGLNVPSGMVRGTPGPLPIIVSLAGLPAPLWEESAPGGAGLRVTKDDGTTLLPRHVVSFDRQRRAGWLVFRAEGLDESRDTEFFLNFGTGAEAPADGGAQDTYAGYEMAFVGNTPVNAATGTRMPDGGVAPMWREVAVSPYFAAHQGVAWDGTHYYVFDTDRLAKYDEGWALVAENATPYANLPAGSDHVADGCVIEGRIISSVSGTDANGEFFRTITEYSAADLSYLRHVDITNDQTGMASCCADPYTRSLFGTSYQDAGEFCEYDLDTLELRDVFTSDQPADVGFGQGITLRDGRFYVNNSDDNTVVCERDGRFLGRAYRDDRGIYEGLDRKGDNLILLIDEGTASDPNARVHELAPGRIPGEGYEGDQTGFLQADPAEEPDLRIEGSMTGLASVVVDTAKRNIIFGAAARGETEDTNNLYTLSTDDVGAIVLGHESGAGANNGFATAGGAVSAGERAHVAFVRDSAALSYRVFNGDAAPTVGGYGANPTGANGTQNFRIGFTGWSRDSAKKLDGAAGFVLVASRALSDDEVRTMLANRADVGAIAFGEPESADVLFKP